MARPGTRPTRFAIATPDFDSRVGDYCQRAFNAASIAPAPDRGDFGKWNDVKDVYFGRYAALVCQYSPGDETYKNEGDWFDYNDANWTAADFVQGGQPQNMTRQVWKYFANYALYWLEKTGVPAGTDLHQSATRHLGIDGLRCDFGQGLPPRAWEYIINVSRTRKWNFVWMSESLDGGEVTYRSNRHFDLLNEKIVFDFQAAVGNQNYRDLFDARRNAYGEGAVLLNTSSHDEQNYVDPWHAMLRYSVAGTQDGAPMIFMGQELGISRDFGFTYYETNFGKLIPHFKRFNSMWPIWEEQTEGLDRLYVSYAGINRARKVCPSLRGVNRYNLNRFGGGINSEIWSIAKYEVAGGSPATSDVVFAFANLNRDEAKSDVFDVNIAGGGGNLFGIDPVRQYNVVNPAAFWDIDPMRPGTKLWPEARTGSDILANGIFVSLNPVPVTDAGWSTSPYEPQYLKLLDVTPPPPSGPPKPPAYYVLTNMVTFCWAAATGGPSDVVTHYLISVGTSPGGNDLVNEANAGTSLCFEVTGSFRQTLYATVVAVSAQDVRSPPRSSHTRIDAGVCETPVILLDPDEDQDQDGCTNAEEDFLGTNPLDATSVFKIVQLVAGNGTIHLRVPTRGGLTYILQRTENYANNPTNIQWDNLTTFVEASMEHRIHEFVVNADSMDRTYRVQARTTNARQVSHTR